MYTISCWLLTHLHKAALKSKTCLTSRRKTIIVCKAVMGSSSTRPAALQGGLRSGGGRGPAGHSCPPAWCSGQWRPHPLPFPGLPPGRGAACRHPQPCRQAAWLHLPGSSRHATHFRKSPCLHNDFHLNSGGWIPCSSSWLCGHWLHLGFGCTSFRLNCSATHDCGYRMLVRPCLHVTDERIWALKHDAGCKHLHMGCHSSTNAMNSHHIAIASVLLQPW